MKEAIRKAIDGGYGYQGFIRGTGDYDSHVSALENGDTLLDPLFWRALGKSCGWSMNPHNNVIAMMPKYLFEWHRFIDVMDNNGDTDKFWDDLLSSQDKPLTNK